jgi:N-acetylneuraminic acid mutarotase
MADAPQRHAGGVGAVINSKFYVAGGHDSQNNPSGLDVYDPVTNTWTTKAAPPARLERGAAYAMLSERLYAIGSQTDMYNPTTNKWSTKAPPNRPREDAAAAKVIVNGAPQIILMGGGDAEGLDYVDRYRP